MTPAQELEWSLVKLLMACNGEQGKGDAELEAMITEAYESGYFILSDGCTLVGELWWPFKAAGCVIHDHQFYLGVSFRRANALMYRCHRYFGNSTVRVATRWLGVWIGGYPAYRAHRKKQRTIPGYGTQAYIDQQISTLDQEIPSEV